MAGVADPDHSNGKVRTKPGTFLAWTFLPLWQSGPTGQMCSVRWASLKWLEVSPRPVQNDCVIAATVFIFHLFLISIYKQNFTSVIISGRT